MKIKHKLLLGTSLLAIIPTLFTALVIGYGALQSSQSALENQVKNQLISIRDATAVNIENYFSTLQRQLITYAGTNSAITALEDLSRSFGRHRMYMRRQVPPEDQKNGLADYYRDTFAPAYGALNPDSAITNEVQDWLNALPESNIAIQYAYLAANPHAPGEKYQQDRSVYDSTYDGTHAYHHPSFRKFAREFGLQDILLIEFETGTVVYSVSKRIDFASSLIDGPFANSPLGEAFRATRDARQEQVVITDVAPYRPHFDQPAQFMSTAVYNKEGNAIGALVFQLPEQRINAVMTHYRKWEEVGLGKSGETYLVGPDGSLRSDSRHLTEDPETYVAGLQDLSDTERAKVKLRGSAVGLQNVDSPAITSAMQGDSGFIRTKNYLGQEVFSAYKALDIPGLNWAILSEITTDEALASVSSLRANILGLILAALAITLILALVAGSTLALTIIRPIRQTVDMLRDIAEGEGDLRQRINRRQDDELGELGHWFDLFTSRLQELFTALNGHVDSLLEASGQLAGTADRTNQRVSGQHHEIQQAASAITEMAASAQETVGNVQSAADKASATNQLAADGANVIANSQQNIYGLANDVAQAAEVIDQLSDDSQEIIGVLEVIENIAEQTNLLALNAAIEAARAGESGRGFAVVADEVRSLAQRTQQSTQQIQDIIDRLQNGSDNAVKAIEQSQQSASTAVELSTSVQQSFDLIKSAIEGISDINHLISSTAEEQSRTIAEIDQNVHNISDLSSETNEDAEHIQAGSQRLGSLASHIKQTLAAYKV